MSREDGEIRDGDVAVYDHCTDPECPHHRPGKEHAHLVEVKRDDQPQEKETT